MFVNKSLKILLFMFMGVLMSCASIPDEPVPELYWPFPPEKPRIKFVDMIIGSIDAVGVRSSKIARLLFGEETEIPFRRPSFIAAKNNVVYITDVNIIHVYDFNKKKFRIIGAGILKNASGIAVSDDGMIYVADSEGKNVYSLTQHNVASVLNNPEGFESPAGLAVDNANSRLIVADSKKHNVTVWDMKSGKNILTIGGRGRAPAEFNFPYDVDVDKEGRIYVSDAGNFRVQIFDKDGFFLFSFGGVGTVAGTFARPKGIAIDPEGNIYVVDSAFGNFQIFSLAGDALLAVGTGGTDAGKFILPSDISIDGNGKIYVVDQMNRRIQVFQYLK